MDNEEKRQRNGNKSILHGEWILDIENSGDAFDKVECSNCKAEISMKTGERYPYCPVCGAKMKNVNKENESDG